MANTFLTISHITNEALMVLNNTLAFTSQIDRQYSNLFGQEGAKRGATVNVRKPIRLVGRQGAALAVEDLTETQVPVTLTDQTGADFSYNSQDRTLSIDMFSERILKPAMAQIANHIDADGLLMAYQATYNTVGTPGSANNSLTNYLTGAAILDLESTPRDDQRALVIDPLSQASVIGALTTFFNPANVIADQYLTGNMGRAAGLKWSIDQNVYGHTVGPLGGTPVVNTAGQTGSSLSTRGWTAAAASRLKKGDVFTIAGVYQINKLSRQSTGRLQQFVVTADFSSDGAGNGSVGISPPITPAGQYMTVTASPADGAAITVLGAANTVTPASIMFHRQAFTLATADLYMPTGSVEGARVMSPQTGLSLRFIKQYNINTDIEAARFDVLYGWAALRPEFAVRVQS